MQQRSLNGPSTFVRPRWLVGAVLLASAVALVPATLRGQTAAREFYVAPDGRSTNDGTVSRPLDLATALSTASPAKPGDTIWLRGGTYRGTFISDLNGQPTAPIVVRQYPGERAIIDSNPSQTDALLARGSYTWFWDFEVMNSDPDRYSSQTGSWPNDLKRGQGIVSRGRFLKFINMVVHDTRQGFSVWAESEGTEVYGSLVYYNGWQAPDRAHGHGFYVQSQIGTKRIADNIVFDHFSHGLHAYGSDVAFLNNITMEGNISFNSGVIGQDGMTRDLLLGGGSVAQNPVVRDNATYGAQVNVGYSAGCTNGIITNNYFVGSGVFIVNCAATVTNNTMHSIYGLSSLPTSYTQNTFLPAAPAGLVVRVRPNLYEAGRANVVIYNWNNASQVNVDLTQAGLTVGQAFEVRDAQNFFGAPVVSGVYGGSPVTLPMTGLTVAPPIGATPVAPRHTAPRFAAFVVVPQRSSQPPANIPPTVSITSPAPSSTFNAPAAIALAASATDPDGSVTSVAFYQNGVLVGTDTTAPYTWSWSGVETGTYSLTAAATDNRGAVSTSAAVSVTVKAGVSPPAAPTNLRILK